MRFGVLPNGLRYVVMKNATPAGQASLRLRIDAGSLDESDSEQGLAHLLEHMAFNGSTHVARGEMVNILERHGLAFGADTNASTSWDETVYKLDLPKADEDTVDTSLMLLREIAGELTLAQDALDKEKGVVLSEERLRDTPGYRVLKASVGFSLEGQLAADRFPIGQVDVVRNATHDQMERFYKTYYRPERAVLVAVGDFDPDAMEAKIKARFGDWTDTAPPGPPPNLGTPVARGAETRLNVQPGSSELLQMGWVARPDRSPDSADKRRRQTIETLGLAVLNRRLDRMVRADAPPFVSAAAFREDEFHSARATVIQGTTNPGAWSAALGAGDQAERQLLAFGVSQAELDQEIDADRAALKAAADGAATRTTPAVAEDIVATLDTPEVETSPAEDLALFDADVKGLAPAEVNAAMKSAFAGSGPLVFLSTQAPVDGGEPALAKAFATAEAAPVQPPSAQAALTWPYADFGAPGKVAEQHEVTDLDAVFVRFANGVRLTVKPTKFRDDQVLVSVRVGDGQLGLPTDRPTTGWAASSAFPEAGLDQLTAQDIDQVLRSKIVGRQFAIGEDAFALDGATRADDLDTQMQLLAAYVVHPGWRPAAFERMHNAAPTILDQMNATPAGVLNRELGQLLHSGDRRWGIPSARRDRRRDPGRPQDPAATGPHWRPDRGGGGGRYLGGQSGRCGGRDLRRPARPARARRAGPGAKRPVSTASPHAGGADPRRARRPGDRPGGLADRRLPVRHPKGAHPQPPGRRDQDAPYRQDPQGRGPDLFARRGVRAVGGLRRLRLHLRPRRDTARAAGGLLQGCRRHRRRPARARYHRRRAGPGQGAGGGFAGEATADQRVLAGGALRRPGRPAAADSHPHLRGAASAHHRRGHPPRGPDLSRPGQGLAAGSGPSAQRRQVRPALSAVTLQRLNATTRGGVNA